ncbi:MAG: hypothetical protein OHK0052_00380 [Anaerolineales bacterium]
MFTDEEIWQILERGEDDEHIFLASSEKRKPLIQAVTALCNAARPGTVWLGVLPDGAVRGLAAEIGRAGSRAALEDALDKMLFAAIVPPSLDFAFEWVDLPDLPPILAVQVWQGPQIPYRVDGTLWVRVNSQTRAASPEEAASLEKRGKFLRRQYALSERAIPALGWLVGVGLAAYVVYYVLIAVLLWFGRPQEMFRRDNVRVNFPSFSPDGKLLAVQACAAAIDEGCWILVLDTKTGGLVEEIQFVEGGRLGGAVWLPGASALLIPDETTNTVWHYTLATHAWFALTSCPVGLRPTDRLAIRPQGDAAVMVCKQDDGYQQVFWFGVQDLRVTEAQPFANLPEYPKMRHPVFSPDGMNLVAVGEQSDNAYGDLLRIRWKTDAPNGWQVWLTASANDQYPAFSADGKFLYVASPIVVSDYFIRQFALDNAQIRETFYIGTRLKAFTPTPKGNDAVAADAKGIALYRMRLYPQWLLRNKTVERWRYGIFLFYEYSLFKE